MSQRNALLRTLTAGLTLAGALTLAIPAAAQAPADAQTLSARAVELYNAGQVAEALPLLQQALALPPSQVPRIFRDPTNPYGYPYNVHQTDGLSRNPDDCIRWGCVDAGGNK